MSNKPPRPHPPKGKTTDPRFARLQSDPRFRLPSKKHNTVKVDSRFARILKDDDFSRKASVDRYGRKIGRNQGRKDLERLYRLGSDDEDDSKVGSGEDDEIVRRELRKADASYDPAREGGFSESSSSEEEDESSDEDSEVGIDGEVEDAELFPAQEGVEVPMGEVTSRLAVVNLDWDNIRAVDLMVVAQSFAPVDGSIRRCTIYPSEFGKERMQREEIEGPPRELFRKKKRSTAEVVIQEDVGTDEDEDSERAESSDEEEERIKKELLKEDKGEEFDASALRRYQIDRLRYYYGVIECSSDGVAQALYEAMDGREYLSTANFFDLRFIPDETSFEDDKPRDACNQIPEGYRPADFVTDALTHSKVKLTWDADDTKRKEVQKRAFSRKEIDENDLQAYIGSASSSDNEDGMSGLEEEEEEQTLYHPMTGEVLETASVTSRATTRQDRRDQMRAALGLPPEPEKSKKSKAKRSAEAAVVGDMQISFTPGLSASAPQKGAVFVNKPEEETTREKYIRKEKERKQKKKDRMLAKREGRDPDAFIGSNSDTEAAKPSIISAETNGVAKSNVIDNENDIHEEEDDPFNDPFFEDPIAAEKEAKKARVLASKRSKREKEIAERESKAKERAELQLLMDDDREVRHFDMKEIKKAEKANGKNKKMKHKKRLEGGGAEEITHGGESQEFKMDVQDPRFAKLFENHEFAIDPSNPRFKGTKGMKSLLEEGRRKRATASSSSSLNASSNFPPSRNGTDDGDSQIKDSKDHGSGDSKMISGAGDIDQSRREQKMMKRGNEDVLELIEKVKKRAKR